MKEIKTYCKDCIFLAKKTCEGHNLDNTYTGCALKKTYLSKGARVQDQYSERKGTLVHVPHGGMSTNPFCLVIFDGDEEPTAELLVYMLPLKEETDAIFATSQ